MACISGIQASLSAVTYMDTSKCMKEGHQSESEPWRRVSTRLAAVFRDAINNDTSDDAFPEVKPLSNVTAKEKEAKPLKQLPISAQSADSYTSEGTTSAGELSDSTFSDGALTDGEFGDDESTEPLVVLGLSICKQLRDQNRCLLKAEKPRQRTTDSRRRLADRDNIDPQAWRAVGERLLSAISSDDCLDDDYGF